MLVKSRRPLSLLALLAAGACGARSPLEEPPVTDAVAPGSPRDAAAPASDARPTTPDAARLPDPVPAIPAGCRNLRVTTPSDFEIRFIIPRCGSGAECHQAVFPPRNLHMQSMIRTSLVGKKSILACKNDFYIDVDRPERSHMLASILPVGTTPVACPSGGSGGTRMPNSSVAVAGPRLSEGEIECFRWWVFEVAASARGR